ncbi:MAG: hypothetical protein RIB47_04290 [Cyclobacteriaceae bacterium]
MGAKKNIAIGLGLAGGALLTAWLFSGSRAQKTKELLLKKAQDLKLSLRKGGNSNDETDVHYL